MVNLDANATGRCKCDGQMHVSHTIGGDCSDCRHCCIVQKSMVSEAKKARENLSGIDMNQKVEKGEGRYKAHVKELAEMAAREAIPKRPPKDTINECLRSATWIMPQCS